MREIMGLLLIWIGILFIAMGVVGIYKFKNFYPRILVASKIDTVGNITLMLGVIIRNGMTFLFIKSVAHFNYNDCN